MDLLSKLKGRKPPTLRLQKAKRRSKARPTVRPSTLSLEQLEQRQMLAVLYWDPTQSGGAALGGSGSWTGANNWWNGTSNVSWTAGDEARFQGSAGTVTLSSAVNATSLSFTTDGYTVSGNTITLSGTGTVVDADESTTISSSIVVGAGQQWDVAASEAVTASGVISGSGSLTKAGSGTLIVSGSNTYTGGTEIKDGTLQLGKNNALPTNTVVTFGIASTNGALELNGFNQQVSGLAVASGATAASQVIGNSSTTTDSTLTYNASGGPTSTFAGTIQDKITGAGTRKTLLAVTGGTLVLTGSNTYTGAKSLSNGATVEFASGGLGTTGTISFGGTSTLRWATGNTTDISGRFSIGGGATGIFDIGSNTVTFANAATSLGAWKKEGSGTLILTNTFNSAANVATISAGTLQIGTGGAAGWLGFGSIVNNASLVFNRSDTVGYNGHISGTGSITKRGTGTLGIGHAGNSYTGGTSIESGTVQFNPGSLGTSGAITFVNNSTLFWYSGSQDLSSRLVINNGVVATFNTNWNNVTFATGIGGTGSVTKVGNGTLTFAAANSYTGTTTVTGGSLVVNSVDGVIGGLTVNGGTSASFVSGGLGASGAITLNGTSTLQWSGVNTEDLSGRLVLASGGVSTLDFGSNNVTFATGFGGSTTARVVKAGAGTLTLAATNSYTGGTTINAGIVEFAAGGVGSSGTVTIGHGSTLRWLTGNTTDMSGRLAIPLSATGALDIGSNNITFASQTTVFGSMVKEGSGTLLLTHNFNSISATATINAGTIQVGNGAAAGWLNFGAIATNASLVFNRSDTVGYSNVISGTGSVTKLGSGMLMLHNANNNYTGGTYIQSGAIEFKEGGLGDSGPIAFTGSATLLWWTGPFSGNSEDVSSRLVINNGIAATFNTSWNNVTFASGFGGGGSGSVTKLGTGTLTYAGANSYTGLTTITGGALVASGSNAVVGGLTINNGTSASFVAGGFGSSGAITLSGTSTLNWTGSNTEDISSRLVLANGAVSTVNFGANDVTFATGFGVGSTGRLVKVGAGTLFLAAANSYTGGTRITGGTVEFASGGLGTSGSIVFPASATLRWANGNTDDISSRYSSDLGANITFDVGANNVTFASSMVVIGNMTKEGAGTLRLTSAMNAGSYTATINAGTLQLGAGGASGSLSFNTIVNNASLVYERSDFAVITYLISGTGQVTQRGSGTIQLTNASNSYTGGTNIQSGAIEFMEGALADSGEITFTGNSTLRWWTNHLGVGNSEDVSGRLVINNGVVATFDTNSNDVTLATGFGGSGSGSVIKVSPGTLTFGAVNSFTGATTVNNGALVYDEEATFAGAGTLTVNNFATVSFHDVLTLANDGLVTLHGNAKAYFIGTLDIAGEGQIVIPSADADLYARGVDSSTPATLTVGEDVIIRGIGHVSGYYSGDELVNQGTIQAENGILFVDLPYTNEGTFAAVGAARLNRDGTELHGSQASVSGTELLLFWTDMTADGVTFDVQESEDGGETFTTAGAATEDRETFLFDKLQRNSSYILRTVATYGDGSKEIYYSAPVSTLDIPDASGWYRTEIVNPNPNGPTFEQVAPNAAVNLSGVFAGSPAGAVLRAFDGLVRDATIPAPEESGGGQFQLSEDPDGSGQVPLYKNAPGHEERFCYIPVSPEGALSVPLRFILRTLGLDGDPNAAMSDDPVRYFDGAVDYSETDLMSHGLGGAFSQTRSWIGSSQWATGQRMGVGWVLNSLPTIQVAFGGQDVSIIRGAMQVETFEFSGNQYIPTSYSPETLEHVDEDGEFIWTDSAGNEIRFYDFTSAPFGREGSFKSMVSASGLVTEVTDWTDDGAIEEVRRQDADENEVESWLYSYLGSSDPNAGRLASVQMRQSDGSSGWNVVRQVDYEYYDGVASFGNLGDLKTAVVKDGDDNILDTSYYRYYTSADEDGFVHGLKFVLDAKSYARFFEDVGDPALANDSQIAGYAQHYFEYDEFGRCTRHDIQATGGTADGGVGMFTYEYFANSEFSADPNDWVYKTIEVLPDGNRNTFYLNAGGAPLLKEFEVVNDEANPDLEGESWLTHYEYNSLGQLVKMARPSAVVDYELDGNNVLDVTLAANSGLIELTEYFSTTTATDSTAGGVASFVSATKVQNGASGTPVLQGTMDYFVKSVDGRTSVVLAHDEVYRNTNGTGAETTSYAYTWHADTVAIASVAVSLPLVSTSQNGSGTANSTTVYRDVYGRPVWTKDAAGYITYTEYDPMTGGVLKEIVDVDTSNTGDFSGLPSGWTTPTGGGLHLIATMEVDPLGRTIALVDPVGNVTYTVFDDPNHEVRVYAGWNAATLNTTGPVAVYREDRAGNYTEFASFIWDDSNGLPVNGFDRPTGTESMADSRTVIQSLSRMLYNSAGQLIANRDYTSLDGVSYSTAPNLGAKGANYLETAGAFSGRGWLSVIVDGTDTTRHLFLDALGRVTQVWLGRDDVPSTDYNGDSVLTREDFRYWVAQNPTAVEGPAGTSIYKGTLNVYDHGEAGGDSNLTESRAFFDSGSGDFYSTHFDYDWRNRQTGMLSPNGVAETLTFDNLGRTTKIQSYGGSTFVSGSIVADDLRAESEFLYDLQGRLFESRVYEVTVNPSTGVGTAGDYLPTDFWYDPRGFLVKTVVGAGPFEKFAYDGAGRKTASLLSFDADELQTDYAAALAVDGDTVVEQSQNWYDANGRMIADATFRRLPGDTTSTGALTPLNAYASANAMWYDAAGRITHDVNFGRHDVLAAVATDFYDASGDLIDVGGDGVPDVVQTTPPEPDTSDDYIVAKFLYDADLSDVGRIDRTVDNVGRILETQYDLMGRTIREIANYEDGAVEEAEVDRDITTEFEYDNYGRLATVTAVNPKGSGAGIANQLTRYLYESPYNALLMTGQASPDSTDVLSQNSAGVWSIMTDSGDHVSTDYDWLNRATSATDQRGVVHEYAYDSAGRLSGDVITSLGLSGENVDGGVRRLGYGYDDLGRRQSMTSYSDVSGTQVVNEVVYAYDGWGNLVEEWQAHDGAVSLSTTPSVQYLYDDGASSGVAKYVRRTDLIYPNGRQVVYDYGSVGAIDDVLSRIQAIGDGTDVHSSYDYLGADWIVGEAYEEPEIKLDFAGGNFAALDRFGRTLDQVWNSYGSTPGVRDEYNYTFDRAGNRTSRTNALESALSQIYEYDDLDQLISAERGNGYEQTWELDGLGNWNSFDDDGSVQTRTTNSANEITSTTGIATPEYDRAGNMISTPKPGDESNAWNLVYDAWNRLVSVSDSVITIEYEYDGQGRRIERVSGSTSEHFFYDGGQVVETQLPDGQSVLQPHQLFVWSLRYVDSPILRDVYSGGVVVSGDRLYFLTDANHNVTAVTDLAGDVEERYDYDPFGRATVYDENWANPTQTSAVGNTLLFAGQDVDAGTGLQYARARWYNSSIGSFVSRDPSGFAAGDLNLYRYVENNPVIYVDPSGLMSLGARMATGAASGWASGTASGFAAGGIMGGPPGAAAGAVAGGIAGAIGGLIVGAFMSPCASFGEVAAAGLAVGLAAGIGEGAAAGLGAAWAAQAAGAGAAGAGAGAAGGALRGAGGAGREALESAVEGAGGAGGRSAASKAAKAVEGGCFVAGTEVLTGEIDVDSIAGVQYAVAQNDRGNGFLFASIAMTLGVAPLAIRRRQRRKQSGDTKPVQMPNSQVDVTNTDDGSMTSEHSAAEVNSMDCKTTCSRASGSPSHELEVPNMIAAQRPLVANIWQGVWLAACLLVATLLAGTGRQSESPVVNVHPTTSLRAFKPIEAIRVGQRVLTTAVEAQQGQSGRTSVDARTWRRLTLSAENHLSDGTFDPIEVETLQPPEWVADHGAQPGAVVPLPLDLRDMGLPDNVEALVVANDPCPELGSGLGRVVLSTVSHLNSDVWEIVVVDHDAQARTIRPTGLHKFYSATRGEWVSAKELLPDEQLVGARGPVVVSSVARVAGIHRIYNMTVEDEHVYRVSALGVLVHNNGCAPPHGMKPDQRALKELVDEASNGGRKALSPSDANTVLDWASEVNYPGWRAGAGDLANPSNWAGGGGRPHIHIPGVGSGHIPVQQPGVLPR